MKGLLKAFKAVGDITDNRIKAVASTCGNPDSYGDVIFPGFWASAVLRGFVENGWLDAGHEWETPIGYPEDAKIIGDELISTCVFHSTDKAQEIRQVVLERQAAGKSVAVSVGFMPDYSKGVFWFETGADLLKYAEANGFDLTRFDTAAIKKLGYCRALVKCQELYEWSIVCVGANPKARAIEAKNYDFENGKARGSTPFEEHLDSVLAAVGEVKSRYSQIAELRAANGRSMSDERKTQLRGIADELLGLIADAKDEPEAEQKTHDLGNRIRLAEARLRTL